LLIKLDSMAGQGLAGFFRTPTRRSPRSRRAADNFNKQVSQLGTGLNDFNARGLRDLQGLVAQGQKTIGRLDRRHLQSGAQTRPVSCSAGRMCRNTVGVGGESLS